MNRVISVKSTELFKVKITVNRVISVRIYSVQRDGGSVPVGTNYSEQSYLRENVRYHQVQ